MNVVGCEEKSLLGLRANPVACRCCFVAVVAVVVVAVAVVVAAVAVVAAVVVVVVAAAAAGVKSESREPSLRQTFLLPGWLFFLQRKRSS